MYDGRTRLSQPGGRRGADALPRAGPADDRPPLGAHLGGAEPRPDRDDLRPRVQRRARPTSRRPRAGRARRLGAAAIRRRHQSDGRTRSVSEKRRGLGRGLGALDPERARPPTTHRRATDRSTCSSPSRGDGAEPDDAGRHGHARRRTARTSLAELERSLTGRRGRHGPPAATPVHLPLPAPQEPPGSPRRHRRPRPRARAPVRRAARSARSGRTRGSRARSSTRTRSPSWSARSARSACCSRSSCGRSRGRRGGRGPLRADHGRAPLAGRPGGRPGRRSRRSSGTPRTTTCCATPCSRTCTAPS